MTTDAIRWIVSSAIQTDSLIWWWVGSCGTQPILMPGSVYYWWLDDSAVFHTTQGTGGHRRHTH